MMSLQSQKYVLDRLTFARSTKVYAVVPTILRLMVLIDTILLK